eukprot:4603949-Amphidinium_carterae.4
MVNTFTHTKPTRQSKLIDKGNCDVVCRLDGVENYEDGGGIGLRLFGKRRLIEDDCEDCASDLSDDEAGHLLSSKTQTNTQRHQQLPLSAEKHTLPKLTLVPDPSLVKFLRRGYKGVFLEFGKRRSRAFLECDLVGFSAACAM